MTLSELYENSYYSNEGGFLLNCNCVDGMKLIEDNIIDLTVTSPPYDDLRKYKGFSFDFENVAKELYRITKQGGTVVWIVGDQTLNGSESGTSFRQALYFKEIGFSLYDTEIYQKQNIMPLTHRRYEQEFEYMFVLCKGKKPNTFNPIMIPCKYAGTEHWGKPTYHKTNDSGLVKVENKKVNDEKQHGNIFCYLTNKSKDTKGHPAPFPEQLANDHIISWSNEGDIVFDPFMGSGTTAKMAQILNRRWIGIELSEDYCKIIKDRLENIE